MRYVAGDKIGRTDFFRNPAFLRALVDLLSGVATPRVLVHAAAVGAEPYSLVMACRLAGCNDIKVEATDIEPSFLEIARRGVYEVDCLKKVPTTARGFFLPGPQRGTVQVSPEIRACVTFLQPASFVDFDPPRIYDAVLALNALTYVSREDQRKAILLMGGYTRNYLALTAVSPSVVKMAVEDAGFEPVERSDWIQVYYGWRDRIRLRPGRREWALPVLPFLIRDWRYSARSLFRRRAATATALKGGLIT
jgi:hypothetical protein